MTSQQSFSEIRYTLLLQYKKIVVVNENCSLSYLELGY